jgi:hypothetical protein
MHFSRRIVVLSIGIIVIVAASAAATWLNRQHVGGLHVSETKYSVDFRAPGESAVRTLAFSEYHLVGNCWKWSRRSTGVICASLDPWTATTSIWPLGFEGGLPSDRLTRDWYDRHQRSVLWPLSEYDGFGIRYDNPAINAKLRAVNLYGESATADYQELRDRVSRADERYTNLRVLTPNGESVGLATRSNVRQQVAADIQRVLDGSFDRGIERAILLLIAPLAIAAWTAVVLFRPVAVGFLRYIDGIRTEAKS